MAWIKRLLSVAGLAGSLALAGCYSSETAVLTAESSRSLAGVSEGVYCHAENRLIPPQVTVAPPVSDALGNNKCRDLYWHAERGQYVDRLSTSMVFRTAGTAVPALWLLQVQTSEGAVARYMPIAAVDGMFIGYDAVGEWPENLLMDSGLALREDGALAGAAPEAVTALLDTVWERVLEDFRADVAFVEDEDGPRLEFRRADVAYRYLVHFREDWSGNTERMRTAMVALADALSLGKHDKTWTEHAE